MRISQAGEKKNGIIQNIDYLTFHYNIAMILKKINLIIISVELPKLLYKEVLLLYMSFLF